MMANIGNMKIILKCLMILICMTGFLVFTCAQTSLTMEESALLKEIGFDSQTMVKVKGLAGSGFTQYETSDPGFIFKDGAPVKTGVVKQPGITLQAPMKDQERLLGVITKALAGTGYIIFISEMDFLNGVSFLTLIKSDDQMDILNYEKPDGINYGIEAADLFKRLMIWDGLFGLVILGADYDWVYIRFKKLPQDIAAFADEVYKFCPDSVDQGVGSVEELIIEIKNSRELFLWWD
ncbi:MAG: DUF4253 domain-containing protein [Spirochaetaceae bacterium]|nr:MAG: DUF4253 domain-containing protein [Spirochaetaceae bacterium]